MGYFKWNAVYNDNTSLPEFTHDGKENLFYDIDRERLIRFEMFNELGILACYNVESGKFFINGKEISFIYKDGDRSFQLTGAPGARYKDLIQFKKAFIDVNTATQEEMSRGIESFNFGYKIGLDFRDVVFNFKVILTLFPDSGKAPLLEVRLVADKDLDGGILEFHYDKVTQQINAPLKVNQGGMITWQLN